MYYVCSDLHGQYKKYKELLKKINFKDNDEMYIIGDVVDRGPEPLPLLLDILSRPNVHMLIGNHEAMMLKAYENKSNFTHWYINGGEVTHKQFQLLPQQSKEFLLDKIRNLPLVIPNLTVGDKKYYLAHACHTLYYIQQPLLYKDSGEHNAKHVLWNRMYQNPDTDIIEKLFGWYYDLYPNTTFLIGHTPVMICNYGRIEDDRGYISSCMNGRVINLDCGCSSKKAATLGCLRLDDDKEFYIK
ncbi:MAG: metallophosphoesterase [Eubacterium sp.]|nr:metallophosphoesterase [Eubacterium sp.]